VALTHAAIPHTAQGGKGVAGAVLLGWAADSVPETCAAPPVALATPGRCTAPPACRARLRLRRGRAPVQGAALRPAPWVAAGELTSCKGAGRCTALTAALAAALAQPLHEALTTTAHAPAPPASPRECLLAAALAQPLHEALTTTAHAPAPPASPRECLLAAALALGLSKDAPGCRQAGCRQAPQEPRTPARAPGRPQAASFLGGAGAAGGAAAPAGTAGEACAAPGKLDLASAVSLATASDAGWGRRSLDARLLANALLPCELPAPPGSPPGAHSLRHSFDTAFGLDKSRWGGAYPQGPAQSRGSLCWGGAAAGAPPGTTAARPPLAPMRSTSISADGVAPSPFMQPYAPPIEAPQAMSGSLLLPLARGFSAPVSPFEVVAAMRSSCPKSVATHG